MHDLATAGTEYCDLGCHSSVELTFGITAISLSVVSLLPGQAMTYKDRHFSSLAGVTKAKAEIIITFIAS
jgi:hypothetical protein